MKAITTCALASEKDGHWASVKPGGELRRLSQLSSEAGRSVSVINQSLSPADRLVDRDVHLISTEEKVEHSNKDGRSAIFHGPCG